MVLACLGLEDQHTASTLEVTRSLVELYNARKDDQMLAGHYYDPHPDLLRAAGFVTPTEEKWCQWLTLFTRCWFERAWVVQEAGRATEVALIIGLQSLSLMTLIKAFVTLGIMHFQCNVLRAFNRRKHLYPEFDHTDRAFTDLISGSWSMQNLLRIWNGAKDGHLESFTYISRNLLSVTHCTDPRDKVYATLGLSREFRNSLAAGSLVNYSWSVSEVFARTTQFIVRRNRKLSVLSLVAIKTAADTSVDLPSWCPNFDHREHDLRLLTPDLDESRLGWNASAGSRSAPQSLTGDWRQLSVKGYRIDTIRSVHAIGASRLHSHLQSMSNVTGMLQLAAEVAQKYVY